MKTAVHSKSKRAKQCRPREKRVCLQSQERASEPQSPQNQFAKKIDPNKARITYARFLRELRARQMDEELEEMKRCLQVESAKMNQLRYAFEQNRCNSQSIENGFSPVPSSAKALTTSPVATKDEAIAFFKEMTASHIATRAKAISLQKEYCSESNLELVSPKNTLNYASTTASPFLTSKMSYAATPKWVSSTSPTTVVGLQQKYCIECNQGLLSPKRTASPFWTILMQPSSCVSSEM